MALSKRLRFEILRRDNHACRYCGRSAPEVQLSVDHVIPVALGGSDEPSNLAASCRDCNGGKTSSSPDQSTVEDVSQRSIRWSAAMEKAAQEMLRAYDEPERKAIHDAVLKAFPRYYYDRIPAHYTEDIDRFIAAGLPEETILEMAYLAATKSGIQKRWAYFSGCCWKKVTQLQERAMQILAEEDGEPISERDIAVMDAADEAELV